MTNQRMQMVGHRGLAKPGGGPARTLDNWSDSTQSKGVALYALQKRSVKLHKIQRHLNTHSVTREASFRAWRPARRVNLVPTASANLLTIKYFHSGSFSCRDSSPSISYLPTLSVLTTDINHATVSACSNCREALKLCA